MNKYHIVIKEVTFAGFDPQNVSASCLFMNQAVCLISMSVICLKFSAGINKHMQTPTHIHMQKLVK